MRDEAWNAEMARVEGAARVFLEEVRQSGARYGAGAGVGPPPLPVVANVALLSLNSVLGGENVLFTAFMRSVVSSAIGLEQPRKDVRRALLDAFDETWKSMSEELARSRLQ